MFVFPMIEKEFSNAVLADATAQTGQQPVGKTIQQNQVNSGNRNTIKDTSKKISNSTLTNPQSGRAIPLTKAFAEEPVVKDQLWNIYTGNPGFYVTEGDNLNFGTVTTLSDSAFLHAQHTVVPKTIKPYGFIGKERIVPNQDWILIIILVLWMIFASVRVGFVKYLGQLIESLVNLNTASRLYHERGYKTMYGAVRLDFIFHAILPLSVYQIARYYNILLPGYPESVFFLVLLLVINGYIFTKILLFRLGGSVMMLKSQTEESVFNIKLYYKALGLFLLPVVTIHGISTESHLITIWIMTGLIIIMYVAAVIRSIYLGIRKDVSIFYLILYLCTLEILPLLLIFKLMSSE